MVPAFWSWGILFFVLLLFVGRVMPQKEIQVAARIVAGLAFFAVVCGLVVLHLVHEKNKDFFCNLLQADECRLLNYPFFRPLIRKPPFSRRGYWQREYEFQQERNRVLNLISPDAAADFFWHEDCLVVLKMALLLLVPFVVF